MISVLIAALLSVTQGFLTTVNLGLRSFSKVSYFDYNVQSTLVISKLKGLSETLRDIRTSTYQIFRIEENTNRTTKFHK